MNMPTVWRLISHNNDRDRAVAWTKQTGYIAIGWGEIGDIDKQGFRSAKEISQAIKRAYPQLGNSTDGGASLWRFYHELKTGDLVILNRDLVVEIAGPYAFMENRRDMGD